MPYLQRKNNRYGFQSCFSQTLKINLSKQLKDFFFWTMFIFSTLVDKNAIVTIERRGNFTIPDKSDVENRQFYHGKDNQITLSRFYNIRFLCQYSMNWYPFDLQKCSLILQMKGKGKDFADLNTDHLMYLGSDEVNQYVVYSNKMQLLPEDPSQVEIVIKLGRNLLTIILTTFVPTVLLNIISYSTVFFKPFFFEATVTVNLTAMLVLTTLFINVLICS